MTGSAMARRLVRWFDGHGRDLPWRRTRDPYAIWVSEVMLQQTRVQTVIPYYHRFLERFPDFLTLAGAEVDEVLGHWSGLGYYRRARQLHAAARRVVEMGALPTTAEELRTLPGVGDYTAAAVASIAFGEPVPVLDGNVVRVMSRYRAEDGDPRRAAVRRRLRQAAAELLDPDRPGDGNQALMELGATLCTPTRPRCSDCPLESGCAAAAAGDPESYPRAVEKRAPVRERRLAALVEDDGRALLFRRPEDAELLAGMWEIPWVPEADDGEAEVALGRRYGGRWRLDGERGTVRHGITHRAIELRVRAARWSPEGAVAEGPEAGWMDAERPDGRPLSALVIKILGCRSGD